MKKVILSIFSATLLFIACQNQAENKSDNDQKAPNTSTATISSMEECYTYTYTNNKDTATLNFTTTNDTIIGKLNYKLYEKDSNKGTIEGEMKGDTLMLNYIFNAEGRESTRQVVMLKKANQLIEATGEMEEKNGKFVFKSLSNLKFGEGIIFSKIDCN